MLAQASKSIKDRSGDEWLSLHQASELIGVHPATLRAWANRGRVASQRTAGGHRRFRRSDIEQWAKARREPSSSIEMLIHNALGRVRLTMDQANMPWLDRLDAEARSRHRDLGRLLLVELAAALDTSASAPSTSPTARALGADYAQLARDQGLTLTETVQAFLFFHDLMVDSLVQMASHLESQASSEWIMLNRRLNEFTNSVLLGLIESHQKLEAERWINP